MRYLAIDPGGRRMGLAVGDDITGVASPLGVADWAGVSAAAEVIVEIAASRGATICVIGLPTTVDGDETPACRRSHALAAAVTAAGLEIALQPEFLTTNEARRRARGSGRPRSAAVDDLAAQVLLEEFLARRRPVRG